MAVITAVDFSLTSSLTGCYRTSIGNGVPMIEVARAESGTCCAQTIPDRGKARGEPMSVTSCLEAKM